MLVLPGALLSSATKLCGLLLVELPPDLETLPPRPSRKTPQTPLRQWPLSKVLRLSVPVRGMAARTVIEPVTAHLPLRFHPLSVCENAMAVSYAGVIIQLHPLAGIDSARSPRFSDDALSYVSLRRAQLAASGTAGRNLLARRRACSTHTWVARISRSIGNSDTTGKVRLWQVRVWGGCTLGNHHGRSSACP